MSNLPRILAAGDCALVVEYGDAIDPEINARVRALARRLEGAAHAGILEVVPTYRSLMVHYSPLVVSAFDIETWVREAEAKVDRVPLTAPRIVEVPVSYGGTFGPDLEAVAKHAGLPADEVVAIHAGAEYLVYMLGFMPGFPYLGGMSSRIATPRLGTPRTVVPAGSVGIAGAQTGVYPTESPGGWRLVGRTPLRLFDVARTPPSLVEAGDVVRFVVVTPDEYAAIAREVAAGTYEPVVRRAEPS